MERNTGIQSPHAASDGRKAAVELAIAYVLILAVIWTPRPLQRFLWIAGAVGVVIILWRSFDGWKAMGFTIANLGRSLWIVLAALALAAAAILIALRLHTLYVPAGGPLAFIETY